MRPYLKNKARTAGGTTQVVEYLPRKYEALSSSTELKGERFL
jgi:hypothetical protein